MSELGFSRFAVVVTLRVGDDIILPNTGFSALAIGSSAAEQVSEHVRAAGLGYFPALDYFRDKPDAVDPALLALLDELAGYCAAYASSELRRRLRRGFAEVAVGQMTASAYAMPQVRAGQTDYRHRLAVHYAPQTLRCELQLTAVKTRDTGDIAQQLEQRLLHWAAPAFEQLELTQYRQLEN